MAWFWVFLLQLLRANAQVSFITVSVVPSPDNFVVGSKTSLEVRMNLANFESNWITLTFGHTAFTGTSPAVAVTLGLGGSSFTTFTSSVSTTSVTRDTLTLTFTAGSTDSRMVVVTMSSQLADFTASMSSSVTVESRMNSAASYSFDAIAPGLAAFTSANGLAGTLPTDLTLSFELPIDIPDGLYIMESNSKTMFGSGSVSGVTATIDGSSHALSLSTSAAWGSGILVYSATFFPRGGAAVLTFDSSILAPYPAGGVSGLSVHITNVFPSVTPTFATSTPGSVSGDPVTWYGGRRAEFELPPDRLTTLLRTPELEVKAAPFIGSRGEQWIGRMVVESVVTGNPIMQIDSHRDLTMFDRESRLGAPVFDTFSLLVPGGVSPEKDHYQQDGVHLAWARSRDCALKRFLPCNEHVMVVSRYVKIHISTAPAREYYESLQDAHKHVHLDFYVVDMAHPEMLEGALPEMWGLKPLSQDTKLLLTKGDPLDVLSEAEGFNETAAKLEECGSCALSPRHKGQSIL